MSNTHLLFIHALSSLHAGTGQGVGVIDLPIARETATGLPYLPGSSIKGTLRDSGAISEDEKQVIFGPPTEYASDNAGSAQFADARLLLLPVRSLAGTFAWVTSPYVLRRFARDVDATTTTALAVIDDWKKPQSPDADNKNGKPEQCKIATGSVLKLTGSTVVLEDLDLAADEATEVAALAATLGKWLFPGDAEIKNDDDDTLKKSKLEIIYWRDALKQRLCIVRDDVLSFLLTTATEVTARIKLKDETKTVDTDTGALWYEEALPAESVLCGLVVATPITKSKYRQRHNGGWSPEFEETTYSADTIFEKLVTVTTPILQFGGKATIGRGVCRAVLVREGSTPVANKAVNGDGDANA